MDKHGRRHLFHTTVKRKTERTLPLKTFRDQDKFVKFIFRFSENYWGSKETIGEQVEVVNRYHQRVIREKGLPVDQKMLIIWNVFCRHCDTDLLAWIKDKFFEHDYSIHPREFDGVVSAIRPLL